MPKNKTHSGTAKRVRLTGKGKLRHEQTNRQHLFEHKSSRRTRRLNGNVDFAPAEVSRIKKLLGR
jgi:large subunit ribosomal protein L35